MKNIFRISLILLVVGLSLTLIAAILGDFTFTGTTLTNIRTWMSDIGFLTAILSGVVLVAASISMAVQGNKDEKK